MKNRKTWLVVGVLAAFGVMLASYLLFLTYSQSGSDSFCYVNASINCEATTTGAISRVFGIPVGWYGLMGYIVIFLAALFRQTKVALGTVVFGVLFCLRLMYLELFVVHVICPVCIACMVVMLAELGLIISIFKTQTRITDIPSSTSAQS